MFGAGGGGRTHTPLPATDFESVSSANSNTPAHIFLIHLHKSSFVPFHPTRPVTLAVPEDSATAVPRFSTAAPFEPSLNHPPDALGSKLPIPTHRLIYYVLELLYYTTYNFQNQVVFNISSKRFKYDFASIFEGGGICIANDGRSFDFVLQAHFTYYLLTITYYLTKPQIF